MCLPACLPICRSTNQSINLSVYLYIYGYLSVFLSIYLSVYLSAIYLSRYCAYVLHASVVKVAIVLYTIILRTVQIYVNSLNMMVRGFSDKSLLLPTCFTLSTNSVGSSQFPEQVKRASESWIWKTSLKIFGDLEMTFFIRNTSRTIAQTRFVPKSASAQLLPDEAFGLCKC